MKQILVSARLTRLGEASTVFPPPDKKKTTEATS